MRTMQPFVTYDNPVARAIAEDSLNDPRVLNDLHPVLQNFIREWVRVCLTPKKTIRPKNDHKTLKRSFAKHTGMYTFTGGIIGAMLEAGYRMEYRDGYPCFNCSINKDKRGRYLPDEKTEYLKLAPYYRGYVEEYGGYWFPEFYKNFDIIAAKYRQDFPPQHDRPEGNRDIIVRPFPKFDPKLMRNQRWSEANPDVIVEYGATGDGYGCEDQPYWHVSIDTPNMHYYGQYMQVHSSSRLTLAQLEDFIKTLEPLATPD